MEKSLRNVGKEIKMVLSYSIKDFKINRVERCKSFPYCNFSIYRGTFYLFEERITKKGFSYVISSEIPFSFTGNNPPTFQDIIEDLKEENNFNSIAPIALKEEKKLCAE